MTPEQIQEDRAERTAHETPRVYCLIMDSGAAWHVTSDGADPVRCPTDGCGLDPHA